MMFECVIPGCRAATDKGICDGCAEHAQPSGKQGQERGDATPGHTDTGKQLEGAGGPLRGPGYSRIKEWLTMERQR